MWGTMIYLVRHGQTDWNLQGKNQGQTDTELNQTGIEQAKVIAEQLKSIKFDVVLSSPLKRALKTAQIIYDGIITPDDRLIERCNGELEGCIGSNALINFADPNDTRYGVEPLPVFRKRITEFWDDVMKKYLGKNVLVVTHAGITIYSQAYFKGEPKDGNYSYYKVKNCEILQFENEFPNKRK